MKVDIAKQAKNPLMKREELWVKIEHAGAATPRRKELLPHIVKTLKTKDNLVIISKIFSDTGTNRSNAKVFVYSKAEDVPRALAEKMQRQLKKGKQPEPEAPKEEKKAEAPKEEEKPAEKKEEAPKEEPKAEEKKEEPKKEEPKPEEKPKEEKPAEEKKPEEKPAEAPKAEEKPAEEK